MTIIESVILGAVQGFTEFIPVSSSGHVMLAEHFMTGAGDHLFVEWINIGTVLALLIFFRARIIQILREVFQDKNYSLARNIVIACIPAGFAGFMLANLIESNSFFNSAWTVVVALFVVGITFIFLEKLPRFSDVESGERLPWKRAFGIGLVQVFALVPGVSRSGATIAAGRVAGLSRANAAEFSFLVSIPIMLGVAAKLFLKSSDRTYLFTNLGTLAIANLVALVTGLIAVGFMMRFLTKNSLAPFGWYRIGLAVLTGAVLLIQ